MTGIEQLTGTIVNCRKCPRLVRWRERVAAEPPRRYQGESYWAKPLAGFGDPAAELLIVGLAPAAHGGNRTGRMFTGDRSGDWLYGALHRYGFANQPKSINRQDGLRLKNCYITAAVRCAPPDNKPSRIEFTRCRPYLVHELAIFENVRVVVALGKIAFDAYLAACRDNGVRIPTPRPVFGHGASYRLDGIELISSYHPSQQNTFTGKLTEPMFCEIFERARSALSH